MFVVSIVLEDVSGQIKGLAKIMSSYSWKCAKNLSRHSFSSVTVYLISPSPASQLSPFSSWYSIIGWYHSKYQYSKVYIKVSVYSKVTDCRYHCWHNWRDWRNWCQILQNTNEVSFYEKGQSLVRNEEF